MYKAKFISGPIKAAIIHYPKSETIAVHLRIKAGSNYETKKMIGVAHMWEHLATKSASYSNALPGIGKLYGVTCRDNILFLVVGMKKDWKKFVTYLAEILKANFNSETDISKQKALIAQEITRYKSIPDKFITRVSYKNLYPNSRMVFLNSGDIEEVNALTLRKVHEYRDQHVFKSNMTITAAGDISASEFKKCIKENFSNFPTNGSCNQIDLKANEKFDIQIFSEDSYALTHVKINFIGRNLSSKCRVSNQVMAYIYNKLVTKELRDKHGYSYKVSCDSFSSGNFGVFSIYYSIEEKKLLSSIKCIRNIFCEDVVSDKMISEAKEELLLDISLNNEKPSYAADYYSELLLFLGPKALKEPISKAIEKIKNSDIRKEINFITQQNPKFTILTKSYNTDKLKSEIRQIWENRK
jgi:predicted Zn-dependent peptidase